MVIAVTELHFTANWLICEIYPNISGNEHKIIRYAHSHPQGSKKQGDRQAGWSGKSVQRREGRLGKH